MTNRMWGGRFVSGPAEIMEEINASIGFDKRLAPHDIRGSLAHAAMLGAAGILPREDVTAIERGLKAIAAEIESGAFTFSRALEDIHMNVEQRLADLIGPSAGRLHTARSRNDQVATDMRLWARDAIDALDGQLAELQTALAEKALAFASCVMPGFTHLQPAQPVTFGHHLLAYVEMLARDRGRFADARRRLNECPLGAAALAGTSFPIDRFMTAAALGFDRPTANSLDSVSDRDFVLETLAAGSICAVHLSRFAEEIVLWMTPQFGFVRLSDAFTTGSSIMPQKRNPDVFELVRGKSGRAVGSLVELLVTLKGLPGGYNRDLQEDRAVLLETAPRTLGVLGILGVGLDGVTFDRARCQAAIDADATQATDVAEALVKKGVPFRTAYGLTGSLVRRLQEARVPLAQVTLAQAQEVDPRFDMEVLEAARPRGSVARKLSAGSTGPASVQSQLQ
ncbi:MAG: argininosuccinate lyase, partial [Microvirga sp.]